MERQRQELMRRYVNNDDKGPILLDKKWLIHASNDELKATLRQYEDTRQAYENEIKMLSPLIKQKHQGYGRMIRRRSELNYRIAELMIKCMEIRGREFMPEYLDLQNPNREKYYGQAL